MEDKLFDQSIDNSQYKPLYKEKLIIRYKRTIWHPIVSYICSLLYLAAGIAIILMSMSLAHFIPYTTGTFAGNVTVLCISIVYTFAYVTLAIIIADAEPQIIKQCSWSRTWLIVGTIFIFSWLIVTIGIFYFPVRWIRSACNKKNANKVQ